MAKYLTTSAAVVSSHVPCKFGVAVEAVCHGFIGRPTLLPSLTKYGAHIKRCTSAIDVGILICLCRFFFVLIITRVCVSASIILLYALILFIAISIGIGIGTVTFTTVWRLEKKQEAIIVVVIVGAHFFFK
jgi:hypothetical protein